MSTDLKDASTQAAIDAANAEFWNELCGSNMAQEYGITDHSLASLERFDSVFFAYYPYLLPLVRPERMRGKSVLEIGLGYGSLGQKLAEFADYTGLDIAANPMKMMNTRLQMRGLSGKAVQGNALAMPFPDQSFDHVISIGCFHHTGNIQRCIDETYRVLKPNGSAIIMVYNKFSYRQWFKWPRSTCKAFFKEFFRLFSPHRGATEEAAAADANSQGHAAPETSFLSKKDLKHALQRFHSLRFYKRNWGHIHIETGVKPFLPLPRRVKNKLVSYLPKHNFRHNVMPILAPLLGLDLYVEAQKPAAARAA